MKEKEGLLILAASFDDKIDFGYLALPCLFYKSRDILKTITAQNYRAAIAFLNDPKGPEADPNPS
ncbi:hypothetical protein ACFW0F_10175 [Brucella anthropi]|uniref:hypothetical protein n=1 Tax=Brucella anthropi TaxID=529 RepID=UPI00366AEA1A